MLQNIFDFLNICWSILFMLIFFGLCIFIHELGHFLAGRLCGLHVSAFSIGFRKIWGKKINGVEYRIGWIPVGGYVELPQIDSAGEAKDEDGNILPKAEPWKRIVTAFAGPLFNILFGLLLGCLIWYCGIPQETPKMDSFRVQSVEEGSPEWNAGLRANDVIVKFNGQNFSYTWTEFARDIMLNVGEVNLEIERNGETMQISYLPIVNKSIAPQDEIPYPFFRPEIPVVIYPAEDSPASQAGLQIGDRITQVNNKPIYDAEELEILSYYSQGKPMVMEYIRDGQTFNTTVMPQPVENISPDKLQYQLGVRFNLQKGPLFVEQVFPGMPGENKLYPGDKVLAIDSVPMESYQQFIQKIQNADGETLTLTVERAGKFLHVPVTPVKLLPHKTGIGFRFMLYPTPFEQFRNVLNLTWRSLKSVSSGVGRKLGFDAGYTTLGPKHFSGPIGIGRSLFMTVYNGGFILGINLVILISFSLGLFNLLPMPVLDGGHILLAVLEIVFRRPLSEKILTPISYAFIFLLIAFMIFVSFYDVKKLIPVSPDQSSALVQEQNDVDKILKIEEALKAWKKQNPDSKNPAVLTYENIFPKKD